MATKVKRTRLDVTFIPTLNVLLFRFGGTVPCRITHTINLVYFTVWIFMGNKKTEGAIKN